MEKTTQEQVLLNHFAKYKTITSMEAFDLYGITRLSAKIYNLREQGYEIEMIWEEGINRYGNPVRWGKYYIKKAPKKQMLMDKILTTRGKKMKKMG